MIRVLIVDDSATVCHALKFILETDPEIKVIGSGANGREAVQQTLALTPDVITMDLWMPVMNGLEATQQIMERLPTPIVMVSARGEMSEVMVLFGALMAGALALVEKPVGMGHTDSMSSQVQLLKTVKLLAQINLVRPERVQVSTAPLPARPHVALSQTPAVIAVGGDIGGPVALARLLKGLPAKFAVPLVVVQHLPKKYLTSLVQWLQFETPLLLKVASHAQPLRAGTVYFAPDDSHLVFLDRQTLGLTQALPVHDLRPSVDVLFEAVAQQFGGAAVGVLLSGQGTDGVAGLKAMYDAGARTIAQNEASCVVYDAPRAAITLNAVDYVLPLEKIASVITALSI